MASPSCPGMRESRSSSLPGQRLCPYPPATLLPSQPIAASPAAAAACSMACSLALPSDSRASASRCTLAPRIPPSGDRSTGVYWPAPAAPLPCLDDFEFIEARVGVPHAAVRGPQHRRPACPGCDHTTRANHGQDLLQVFSPAALPPSLPFFRECIEALEATKLQPRRGNLQ